MGGLKETVSELAVKVGELYKELVTNTYCSIYRVTSIHKRNFGRIQAFARKVK